MEMLWIPLISQIGRNHQNMWKKSVFLKVLDNVWTCFEITSWQKSSKKTKKTQKTLEKHRFPPMLFCPGDIFIFISIYLPAITCSHFKLRPSPTYWPTVCLPIYLCVYIHICMYWFLDLYIYLQLPAVILSSDPPQPIDLLSAYLFIYVYIYMYVFIFIFIYLPAITCSHSKFRPSPTYWPTVCLPIYLCIYIYVCIYFYIYIFTCNHLQSF